MAVGIELARAMEPLTFFQMKVFNAQLAIRYKSATQLNTQTYCEKARYTFFTTYMFPYRAASHLHHPPAEGLVFLFFAAYGSASEPSA